MAGKRGREKSNKYEIYSWLPQRVTRSQARKKKLENLPKIPENEKRPSPSMIPARNPVRDQALPGHPAIPNPRGPRITPKPTPKSPAPQAAQNPKPQPKTITEILNDLYTNYDYPTD